MMEITTGDNTILQVQLNINDAPLTVAPTSISVLLVSKDRKSKYMTTQEEQSPLSTDADWDTGLVTILLPGTATDAITYQGKALLEVQATFAADLDRTYWFSCEIKKGWVGAPAS